jgi:hypothetical protein
MLQENYGAGNTLMLGAFYKEKESLNRRRLHLLPSGEVM